MKKINKQIVEAKRKRGEKKKRNFKRLKDFCRVASRVFKVVVVLLWHHDVKLADEMFICRNKISESIDIAKYIIFKTLQALFLNNFS